MSCCGEKRALWKTQAAVRDRQTPARPATPAAEPPVAGETSQTALRYLGNGALSLRGPSTGRVYLFTGGDTMALVDKKDLDALLRTRLFALAAAN